MLLLYSIIRQQHTVAASLTLTYHTVSVVSYLGLLFSQKRNHDEEDDDA
jgi:hypothetical protein